MTTWYTDNCPTPSAEHKEMAKTRQANLTKPAGSLGRLETIAEQFAAWQGKEQASIDTIAIRIFAADHGVCSQNISAFPQEVTMQMIMNFINGGAAISVLSHQEKADFAVVNMGIATPLPINELEKAIDSQQLIQIDIASGTADFSQTSAMSTTQLDQALLAGKKVISNLINSAQKVDLFIGGEMGIGNTTSSSAVYSALLNIDPTQTCGPGTGIDKSGVQHKAAVIQQALALHSLDQHDDLNDSSYAYDVLCKVGGFEIAGLVGAYIFAAQNKIPSLIDGFICTAAALLAVRINPSCQDWFLFSHQSAEPAHTLALESLGASPLLNIGMRLGEGSGAAVCIPLLKTALALHREMATFAEASVASQN